MQILDLLNIGSEKLKKSQIISHKLDAELLLAKTLNKRREEIIINFHEKVSKNNIDNFEKLIFRRSTHEPVAYILKEKEFWSKRFVVDKNVLIPRPETELIVDKIINFYKDKKINILDIGTGSGCILLSILTELKNSKGYGIDISQKAIKIAKKNSEKLFLSEKCKFFRKSLDEAQFFNFDLVVSNPPYIRKSELKNLNSDVKKFEPKLALDGGNDGLDLIKKVIYKSRRFLKVNGMLALEIGNEHYKQVSKILNKNNFRIKYLIKDYKDNIRSILSIKQM